MLLAAGRATTSNLQLDNPVYFSLKKLSSSTTYIGCVLNAIYSNRVFSVNESYQYLTGCCNDYPYLEDCLNNLLPNVQVCLTLYWV